MGRRESVRGRLGNARALLFLLSSHVSFSPAIPRPASSRSPWRASRSSGVTTCECMEERERERERRRRVGGFSPSLGALVPLFHLSVSVFFSLLPSAPSSASWTSRPTRAWTWGRCGHHRCGPSRIERGEIEGVQLKEVLFFIFIHSHTPLAKRTTAARAGGSAPTARRPAPRTAATRPDREAADPEKAVARPSKAATQAPVAGRRVPW